MSSPHRLLLVGSLGALLLLAVEACLTTAETSLTHWLQRPYPLSLQRQDTERSYFHMETVYTHLNASGEITQRQILDGYFCRTPTRGTPEQDGEAFDWKFVRIGTAQGRDEIQEWKILSFTRGFRYIFTRWTHDRFPVDQTSIPKTMEGWQFFVKLLDAHTFDVIARKENYDRKLERVGDTARLSGDQLMVVMDFPPLFTDTHFTNSPFYTTFRGITLFHQEPCAILSFRSDDCRVRLVAHMNNRELPTEGASSYHGEILLSLQTGGAVWGKIQERVDMVTTLLDSGTPMRHVTRREITLQKISRPAFEGAGEPGAGRSHPFVLNDPL